MLPWLGEQLTQFWGPFGCSIPTYFWRALAPRWRRSVPGLRCRVYGTGFPRSRACLRGRCRKGQGEASWRGTDLCLGLCHRRPARHAFDWRVVGVVGCIVLSMLEGYLDDRSHGWGEYRLGALDLGVSSSAR